MADEICGIIAPRQEDPLNYDLFENKGSSAECIRTYAHFGPHLVKTPSGKYFVWESEDDCGCCEIDDPDRCFTFGEITKEDAEKLIKGQE